MYTTRYIWFELINRCKACILHLWFTRNSIRFIFGNIFSFLTTRYIICHILTKNALTLGWGIGYPTRTGTRPEPDPNGSGSVRIAHCRLRVFSVQYPFTLQKPEPKYLIYWKLFNIKYKGTEKFFKKIIYKKNYYSQVKPPRRCGN